MVQLWGPIDFQIKIYRQLCQIGAIALAHGARRASHSTAVLGFRVERNLWLCVRLERVSSYLDIDMAQTMVYAAGAGEGLFTAHRLATYVVDGNQFFR